MKIGNGDIAQLGERLPCKQEVAGSIPTISTKTIEAGRLLRIDESVQVIERLHLVLKGSESSDSDSIRKPAKRL